MKFRKLLLLAVLFIFSFVLVFPVESKAAGKVDLNKKKLTLEVGETYQLRVKNTKSRIRWSSTNRRVVAVKNGRLNAKAMGDAWITARVNGRKYMCRVTVIDCEGMSLEQKQVVKYALKHVGNRYRYGGSSLTRGTDCSGFTMAVYSKFGYNLFHNASQQLKDTKRVKMKNIQPGDLLFYGYSRSSCSHVGLYIGHGKIVHASTESTGIVVSDYDYRKCVGAGRVLKKATYPDEDDNITRYAEGKKKNKKKK